MLPSPAIAVHDRTLLLFVEVLEDVGIEISSQLQPVYRTLLSL